MPDAPAALIIVDKIPLRCPQCETPIQHFSLKRVRLEAVDVYACSACRILFRVEAKLDCTHCDCWPKGLGCCRCAPKYPKPLHSDDHGARDAEAANHD
jgi:hypothetical protein